jgi:hypothetical protein
MPYVDDDDDDDDENDYDETCVKNFAKSFLFFIFENFTKAIKCYFQ